MRRRCRIPLVGRAPSLVRRPHSRMLHQAVRSDAKPWTNTWMSGGGGVFGAGSFSTAYRIRASSTTRYFRRHPARFMRNLTELSKTCSWRHTIGKLNASEEFSCELWLIHRICIHIIKYEIHLRKNTNYRFLEEDKAFCERLRKLLRRL